MAMTSRIWVDVRDTECAMIAERLRRLGFIVEGFFPVLGKTHEPHTQYENVNCGGECSTERIELPASSRVWSSNHQSIAATDDLPTDAEVVRQFRLLRQSTPPTRKCGTCMDAACEPPTVKGETPNVELTGAARLYRAASSD